jgi:Pyridoxamine 5'-phosphate oxidase
MDLSTVAPAFVEMAHRIVWCTVATVDPAGRPWTRILHPIWEWDGEDLTGWIATGPTPLKRAHLAAHPYVSLTYWNPDHDTCTADCGAALDFDDEVRTAVWNRFVEAPTPVGYDPAVIPVWTSPTADTFVAMKLTPTRLRVMPGEVMVQGRAELLLSWTQ